MLRSLTALLRELTHFIFDVSGKILEEIDVESSETISSVFLKTRHLASVTSDETLYYGTDHQGTTVLMTDESGIKVWTSEATPFGDAIVTRTGNRDDLALKYTGKDLDEDTGLYYFNARWYDASTGRFISEDPARDGANWFVYVSNNPLKYIDPTGMRIDDDLDEDLNRESTRTNPGGSQNPTPEDGGGNGPEPKPEDEDEPITTPIDGKTTEPTIPEEIKSLLLEIIDLEDYLRVTYGSKDISVAQELYERIEIKISKTENPTEILLHATSKSIEKQIYTDGTRHYQESGTTSQTSDITLSLDIISKTDNGYELKSLEGCSLYGSSEGSINASVSYEIDNSKTFVGAYGKGYFSTTEGVKTFEVGIR